MLSKTKLKGVIFGNGEFQNAGTNVAPLGKKPLIVTGSSSARKSGNLDNLKKQFEKINMSVTIYEGVNPEPNYAEIDRAAAFAEKNDCDLIVGMGGGSVLDTTKAIAGVAYQEISSWELTEWGRDDGNQARVVDKPLPIVCIPTTIGPGSEANGTGVISNIENFDKAVFVQASLIPDLAIIDPELSLTMNNNALRWGIKDILAHGIEDYLTSENPGKAESKRIEKFTKVIWELENILSNNPKNLYALSKLSKTATAVWTDNYSNDETPWTLHAIAHLLGGRSKMGHSQTIAVLLPIWIEHIKTIDPTRMAGMCEQKMISRNDLSYQKKVGVDIKKVSKDILDTYGNGKELWGWPNVNSDDLIKIINGFEGKLFERSP